MDLFRAVRLEAEMRALPVRALGGIGVLLRAGNPHSKLERAYEDLDVAAPAGTRPTIEAAMSILGLESETRFNALHGDRRQIWWTEDRAAHVDVFLGEFDMCHRLDLEPSLRTQHDAVPAADLALMKLQVVELTQKDATDIAALLLTHELGDSDNEGLLDVRRLAEVLGRDWGFFTTVSDNLERLPAIVATIDPGLEHQIARVAESIASVLEKAPKTRRFQLRKRVGRRVPWYTIPDPSL